MIVSHRHRFVFFAQPRTGSHAVRAALQPVLGKEDWQQQALTAQLRLPVAALARIGHGHISLRQARAHLPPEVCRDYFKFAIVRNPYDRFVSACAFLYRTNPVYRGNEAYFRNDALTSLADHMLIRPQADLLIDDSGRLGMDYIGRYETLDDSFGTASRLAGLPELTLPRLNASDHAPYRTCYDGPLSRAVADFYRRDFELLGYPDTLTEEPTNATCAAPSDR